MDERSRYLRKLVVSGIEATKKGHIGSALSLVEIIRVLYDDILNYRPQEPLWPDRDRFILSKGHGCLALYAVLADKGFIKTDELKTYALEGSRLGGCSESIVPGVEATTGALGHGLAVGIGMAMAARMQKRPSRVYVVMGDGELNEGSVWEGALCAAKYKLSHLTVIIDCNKFQIAGSTRDVLDLEPLKEKWESFGFVTREVDGHDVNALRKIYKELPFSNTKPSAIIAHTVKTKGVTFAEGDYKWHWKSGLDEATLNKIKASLEND
ncbi:MAG: transketolase [Candidatus Omnitrophica bacterium]|nr:transketolase [Candidatus Omnitrophota bacterium]